MEPPLVAFHLCSAVQRGDVALLKLLLEAGASPDLALYGRTTPLHVAAAANSLKAVRGAISNRNQQS